MAPFSPQQYQTSAAKIALLNSLAQGEMQTPLPQTQVVPGGAPGSGGFVVPNSGMSIAGSALQRLLGAYMVNKGIQEKSALDTQAANYVSNMLNPQPQAPEAGGQSTAQPGAQGSASGSGTNPSPSGPSSGSGGTNPYNPSTFMQLGMMGKIGEEGQQMLGMEANRWQYIPVQRTGAIVKVDRFGQLPSQVVQPGQFNQQDAVSYQKQVGGANLQDPNVVASLNHQGHLGGVIPLGQQWSADDFKAYGEGGQVAVKHEQAQTDLASAQKQEADAETAYKEAQTTQVTPQALADIQEKLALAQANVKRAQLEEVQSVAEGIKAQGNNAANMATMARLRTGQTVLSQMLALTYKPDFRAGPLVPKLNAVKTPDERLFDSLSVQNVFQAAASAVPSQLRVGELQLYQGEAAPTRSMDTQSLRQRLQVELQAIERQEQAYSMAGVGAPTAVPQPMNNGGQGAAPQGNTGFIVGKQYKDANGNVATYLGNGKWK